jgi:hypothetical protein
MIRERVVIRHCRDTFHQWVRIPLDLVARCQSVEKISPFSLMDRQYAYLEADVDAPLVLNALLKAGYELDEVPGRDLPSPVGRCGRFDAYFARNPLIDGADVSLNDGRRGSVRVFEDSLIVRTDDGALHHITEPGRFSEYLCEPSGNVLTAILRNDQILYERRYVHDVDPGLEQAIECVLQARRLGNAVGVWQSHEEPGGDYAEAFLCWCYEGEAEAKTMINDMAVGKPTTIEEFYSGASADGSAMEDRHDLEADDDSAMEP